MHMYSTSWKYPLILAFLYYLKDAVQQGVDCCTLQKISTSVCAKSVPELERIWTMLRVLQMHIRGATKP
ncbi:hypothetical protein XENTR_v10008186 [Xenopus tropicalis]|nr:hypothetical protein XENTR_v10008186 [Xenopus tropicalis]